MHATSCPALEPCGSTDASTETALAPCSSALHHELSPDLLQAGLRSGLHPRRWLRLKRSLPSRFVSSALGPPVALALALATMTLVGAVAAVFVSVAAALLGLSAYLGVFAGAAAATGAAVTMTATMVDRRRRERRGELPLDWARPLMVELVDWLAPLLEPDQPVAFDFHDGHSTGITLALTGQRELQVAISRREHGPRVGVTLELPVGAHLVRRQSWPGDLGVTVSALGTSSRVRLSLTENDALAQRMQSIARITAELCGANRAVACPMSDVDSMVRLVPGAARVLSPPSGARSTTATWRSAPVHRGVGIARALRSADFVTWTSGASSAAVILGACVDVTAFTAAAIGLPLAAAARGTTALVTRPRRAAGPPSPTRNTALTHQQLELDADGHTLRLGETTVDLAEPFRVTLTRAPRAHRGLREMTLEVFQLQAPGPVALRVAVVAHDTLSLDALDTWDARVPRIDARSFADWLWPALCFFADTHGHRLPFAFKVEHHALPIC